jgi:hypothetical protein
VARRGVLTSEAVGAAVADDGTNVNGFKVREGAPSSAPELHMSDADIRPCLSNDEKQRSESSPAAVEVDHVIHGGGWGSGSIISKPRTKRA